MLCYLCPLTLPFHCHWFTAADKLTLGTLCRSDGSSVSRSSNMMSINGLWRCIQIWKVILQPYCLKVNDVSICKLSGGNGTRCGSYICFWRRKCAVKSSHVMSSVLLNLQHFTSAIKWPIKNHLQKFTPLQKIGAIPYKYLISNCVGYCKEDYFRAWDIFYGCFSSLKHMVDLREINDYVLQ